MDGMPVPTFGADEPASTTSPPVPAVAASGQTGPQPGQRPWADLDRFVHAAQGRLTGGLSPAGQALAWLDWGAHLANAPFRRLDLAQLAFQQWWRLGEAALGATAITPAKGDHRFGDRAWQTLPFSLMQQGFLLGEEWWAAATAGPGGTNRADRRTVAFNARQVMDMFSPSNVPWLNPEVIRATLSTGGRNLQAGFRNLRTDLQEAATGRPAEDSLLVVGRDLAATPGSVIFRNELIELIQYAPTTPSVGREPVLVVPAWIMKYYILDLSAQNSLIGWLVGQGHTVFAISWRNPDRAMAETSLDEYRSNGVMAALQAISAVCDGARVHATGYCLGGTLLAMTAAAMVRDGDDRLASVTLFCAQTDFTEAGELQLFITEDQLAFLEDVMRTQGTLESRQMAGAFQLLRSNDLIWSRAIKSYLLGERELPNDLMAWNADGTRMPATMHSQYLWHLFLDNDLAEGRMPAGGRPVSLGNIRVPFFVVGTETDHIAPWRSVYKLHLLNDGDLTFVLTSGGHNAGVVSEPGHKHRHFRMRRREPGSPYVAPDAWVPLAEGKEGSWWPAWAAWLDQHSSGMAPPPPMGTSAYPPLADAPGDYVHEH